MIIKFYLIKGHDFGKTALTKILQELSESNKILAKTFGKSVIYCAKQTTPPPEDNLEMESKEINEKVELLNQECKTKHKKLADLSGLRTEEAIQKTLELSSQVLYLIIRMQY